MNHSKQISRKITQFFKIAGLSIAFFSVLFIVEAFKQPKQLKNIWRAPKEADATINPFVNDLSAAAKGKIIYHTQCATCHGEKGKGDGSGGIGLNKKPADHTSVNVQVMSDGALFWMITNGNSPMPSYKYMIKEPERWQLVNYIRTLAVAKNKQ